MIEVSYIPDLPHDEFRCGHGIYEGIVMHSTAVYGDCAIGERKYECDHHAEAFVHAFSDPHGTLEVADPAYIAWGAGPIANQRFLHSELCQVKNDFTGESLTLFKASYGHWIDYAAQRLYDRKLGVTCACQEGTGTLWQHKHVSDWLGGSDHSDPMDYLKTWSVTWDQVVMDVQNKYKELETVDEILKRLAALEDQAKVLVKTPAPDWFIAEFGNDEIAAYLKEASGDVDFWRNFAVILRVFKAKGL